MRIDIKINSGEYVASYENYDDAMRDLQRLKNNENRIKREEILCRTIKTHKIDDLAKIFSQCRCPKCVYDGFCSSVDINGNCKEYKRDPPDDGYYG